MQKEITQKVEESKKKWDKYAVNYDKHIVNGHPDIVNFIKFEEEFINNILLFLSARQSRPLKLFDVCSGSGRIHNYYYNLYKNSNEETVFPSKLKWIHGIDISKNLLDIAKNKLEFDTGTDSKEIDKLKFSFEQKSAFDLSFENNDFITVATNLLNTIGVLQPPEGSQKLFKSIRDLTEKNGGIGIISCFEKKYVETHALNQYESTMQVSGQPIWTFPNEYTSSGYTFVPKEYKTKGNVSHDTVVDVIDKNGDIIRENFTIKRNFSKTHSTILSGNVKTFTGYESMWYSYEVIDQWIKKYWDGLPAYHFETQTIDKTKAEAGQIAILDCGDNLKNYFNKG
ncbi:MAG: class I SAM-dependent methyltransferase [Ignavibacteria bacterium]|jgi:ubiquinone/menaquinone biosynthesis C-methylase UbiE